MKIVKKTLLVILYILLIAVTGGYFFINYLAKRSLPDYNKEVILNGLENPVKVIRDSMAIPHIYAQNEKDLYRTAGYVMAQDRLWQMDLIRRVTQGRLAEIFGKDMVQTDLFLRALRIPNKSHLVFEDCTLEQQAAFTTYADGVNQYIRQHIHKLPPEFAILGYKPEEWKPEHSMNIIGYMAWDLAKDAYSTEITLYKIIQKLGMEKANGLIPDMTSRKEIVYPGFNVDSLLLQSNTSLLDGDKILDELGLKVFFGSSNWAVSGKKSITGKPILANDMHLGLGLPGIWYQIHEVIDGKLNVTGLAVPGQPLVVVGHNENIAWGITNVYEDDIDLYLEKLNPADTNQYLFNGIWKNMEIRNEIIRIKGGDSVVIANRFTHRGPIISRFKNMKEAISMHWIGNDYSNEVRSVYLLDRAENWSDFTRALHTFNALSQNFAYADIDGNIGMYAGGGFPIREGAGYFIKPGDTDKYDWTGRVPFEERPHLYNPESGMVSSANNKSVDNDFPYYITAYYAQNYRIGRIREMLKAKEKLSVEDFEAMQADQNSLMVREFLPDILKSISESGLNSEEKEAFVLLKNWDGNMEAEKPEPIIFEQFYHFWIRNLLKDDLGASLFTEYYENSILSRNFMENFRLNRDTTWCDDLTTPNISESYEQIVLKTFKETIEFLKNQFNSEPGQWKWADVHQFTFTHPLAKVKILDRVFGLNRGPYRVGGSWHTVSPYSYPFSDLYNVNHGSSHRHIFSTADWDESLTVIPAGESGIPASKYYGNQIDMYLHNVYHPDFFSRKRVESFGRFETEFSPAR